MGKVFAEPTNGFPDDIKEVNWISVSPIISET
jgi:hypothetical protein